MLPHGSWSLVLPNGIEKECPRVHSPEVGTGCSLSSHEGQYGVSFTMLHPGSSPSCLLASAFSQTQGSTEGTVGRGGGKAAWMGSGRSPASALCGLSYSVCRSCIGR